MFDSLDVQSKNVAAVITEKMVFTKIWIKEWTKMHNSVSDCEDLWSPFFAFQLCATLCWSNEIHRILLLQKNKQRNRNVDTFAMCCKAQKHDCTKKE